MSKGLETKEHILQCEFSSANATWRKSIEKLNLWLTEQQTAPTLREAIVLSLYQWRRSRPLTSTLPIVRKQLQLGWFGMIVGHPIKGWDQVQQEYYTSISSKKTGRRWLTQLLKCLMSIAWDMWSDRNNIKHNTMNHKRLHQMKLLDLDIEEEIQSGYASLPVSVHHLFHHT